MMKLALTTFAALAALALTVVQPAVAQEPAKSAQKDIVATAVGAGDLKILIAAVKQAGLVETLQGAGPFTVFAPIDEAFTKLPEGTITSLLKLENKDKLKAVLTCHVVAGKVLVKEVTKLSEVKTVQGSSVNIRVADDKVFIGDAQVVKTDIWCSNGVIHLIDKVLLPK